MKDLQYSFSVEYARKYGLNEAIMLHNFIYWININKANNNNFINGRYWTYNSSKAFQKLFPFWTQKQIEYTLSKMVDTGILIKDCFNEDKRDRTAWYTLSDDFFSKCISEKKEMDTTNLGNDISEKKEIIYITDKKQQIKNTNKNNINTASGFSQSTMSEIPNSSVSANFTHTQPIVKENLTTQKQNESELKSKHEIQEFVTNFKAKEVIVDGALQTTSIFSASEIDLITEFILRRKEAYKSKVKNTQKALTGVLNDILQVMKEIPLEIIFEQLEGIYVHCGTAGDKTKPFQTIKLDYFKHLKQKPTFNNQNANTNTVREYLKNNEQRIRSFNPFDNLDNL